MRATRWRAASSCCSSNPTTDGIRNLPGSDDTITTFSRSPALRLNSENTALRFGTTTATKNRVGHLEVRIRPGVYRRRAVVPQVSYAWSQRAGEFSAR